MSLAEQRQDARQFEIGVDIGGTFTDIVCRERNGALRLMKLPTTRRDPSEAVIASIALMAEKWAIRPAEIRRFVHGTTVATNAVLERKGARVGLITTAGFRDVLEIGRQSRTHVYEIILQPETPTFLAPRRLRKDVRERVGPMGEVLAALDEETLLRAADELVAAGVEAIAVCFIFAFANPEHERRAKVLISERHPHVALSLSHEVDPAFREYERTVVTAFDAYLKPVVDKYLAQLESGLARVGVSAPLQVMQSRGGLSAAKVARQRPVRLFLSGPAAGVIGGRLAAAAAAAEDLITIDIGGTSADIALVSKRKPMIRSEGLIGGYTVRVPMVDVNTIGSGGGSIAHLDGMGGLRVGPRSAGSDPGPACYGLGGTEATVTDASVVLGYLDPDYFAGGSLKLQAALAERTIAEKIARPLGLDVAEAALGIHRVLNTQMAEGIRLVSVRQGIDPRSYSLVPLGGAGGIHATALARELGMTRVIIPRIPGVLAAAGLLAAPTEHEVSAAFGAPLADIDMAALHNVADKIDRQASSLMLAEGVRPGEVSIDYYADVCYIGQSYNLEIALHLADDEPIERLYRDFLKVHDRVYGHSVAGPAKIVNIRTVHQAGGLEVLPEMKFAASGEPAELGQRSVRVAGEPKPVTAVVYRRDALAPGFRFTGPAIVQQSDTTTLIEPQWSCLTDDLGNLILSCV